MGEVRAGLLGVFQRRADLEHARGIAGASARPAGPEQVAFAGHGAQVRERRDNPAGILEGVDENNPVQESHKSRPQLVRSRYGVDRIAAVRERRPGAAVGTGRATDQDPGPTCLVAA